MINDVHKYQIQKMKIDYDNDLKNKYDAIEESKRIKNEFLSQQQFLNAVQNNQARL
jgi:hypothetical protein